MQGFARLVPKAHVGEMSFIDEGEASAKVVAETHVVAVRLERKGLESALAQDDKLAHGIHRAMLRQLVSRLRATSARMV